MNQTNAIMTVLDEETDYNWSLEQDTETYTEISSAGGIFVVSAWDSNELDRWSVTYREEEGQDAEVPDELPVETDEVPDLVEQLCDENL